MTPPPRQIGRYTIHQEIAAGGMASVHLGRFAGPGGFSRTVAIKILFPQFARDPSFVAMFMDEARLAARIQHPNVVSVVDIVSRDGEIFLVMDYVDGESVARLLANAIVHGAPIAHDVVSAIACQTLHGLHAAHEARSERGEPLELVHRDVSPQNILVGRDGHARVLDFGVAKATGRSHATRDGMMKGKIAYIAPEQLLGRQVDRRADVFATCVVLWELLTNQRMYASDEEASILWSVVHQRPPPPSAFAPGLPPGLDAVILAGLEKDPQNRPASAHDLAVHLEGLLPPASPLVVSRHVMASVGEVLEERATLVRAIEQVPLGAAASVVPGEIPSLLPNDVPPRAAAPPPRIVVETTRTPSLDLELELAPTSVRPVARTHATPLVQVGAEAATHVHGEMAAIPEMDRMTFDLAGQSERAPAAGPTASMHRTRNAQPTPATPTTSRRPGLAIAAGAVVAVAALGFAGYKLFWRDEPPPPVAAPARDLDAHARTLCEATRVRFLQGDVHTGLALEGWVAELWIAGKPGVDPAAALGSLLEGTDLAARARGSLGGESGEAEVVSVPAPPHSRAPSEGAALRLSNAYAQRLLGGKETPAFVELADRAFDRAEARAGALYARCAHLQRHDTIVWVRGRTPKDAAAALLYATSYDESPVLPLTWLGERYDSLLLPLTEAGENLTEAKVVSFVQGAGGTATPRDAGVRMLFDVEKPQVSRMAAQSAGRAIKIVPP